MLPLALGKNLKKYREQRGLTQQKLASLAECSRSAITEIENGNRWVGNEMLAKLAEALGCTAADLLKED